VFLFVHYFANYILALGLCCVFMPFLSDKNHFSIMFSIKQKRN